MLTTSPFRIRHWITVLGLATLSPWTAGCGSNSDDPPPFTPPPPGGNKDAGPDADPGDGEGDGNIHASPSGLDTNPGTTARPVRTLKQAIAIAKSGQTIVLADGRYDTASGETWPQSVAKPVTIEGSSNAVLGGTPDAFGLVFPQGGGVRGLAFESFRFAVVATGTISIANAKVTGGGGFAFSQDARATVKDVTLDRLVQVGVFVADNSQLQMTGGSISGATEPPLTAEGCANLVGIALGGRSNATVSGVALANLGSTGIAAIEDAVGTVTGSTMSRAALADACSSSHVAVGGRASITVEDSSLVNERGAGLLVVDATAQLTFRRSNVKNSMYGAIAAGKLVVQDSTFEGCRENGISFMKGGDGRVFGSTITAKYGLDTSEGSTVVLRRSTVTGQVFGVGISNGEADLGTASDPGQNRISGEVLGLLAQSQNGYPTLVHAAGNTWRPNVQGANAEGLYAPGPVTMPQGPEGGNFGLTAGATIEF